MIALVATNEAALAVPKARLAVVARLCGVRVVPKKAGVGRAGQLQAAAAGRGGGHSHAAVSFGRGRAVVGVCIAVDLVKVD